MNFSSNGITRTIFLAAAFFLLVSCFRVRSIDVTSEISPELWGDCGNGVVFSLTEDVFIVFLSGDEYLGIEGLALSPSLEFNAGRGKEHLTPHSIEEYLRNPTNQVTMVVGGQARTELIDVRGVVTRGTRLKCSFIKKLSASALFPVVTGSTLHRYGIILDGDFKDEEVEIGDLQEYCCDVDDLPVYNLDKSLTVIEQ